VDSSAIGSTASDEPPEDSISIETGGKKGCTPYLADNRHRECRIARNRQRKLLKVLACILLRGADALVPLPLTVTCGSEEARLKYEGIKFSGIALADVAVAPRATAKGAIALMPLIVAVMLMVDGSLRY
jgi:hypothetical protein